MTTKAKARATRIKRPPSGRGFSPSTYRYRLQRAERDVHFTTFDGPNLRPVNTALVGRVAGVSAISPWVNPIVPLELQSGLVQICHGLVRAVPQFFVFRYGRTNA
jgi:hypothetical protein